jgi:excisionase family DNA binding protein
MSAEQPPLSGWDTGEQLLTVDDVCRWFVVTRDWVYDEVEAGRLPFVRLGRRHLRFRREDLDHYLADRRSP